MGFIDLCQNALDFLYPAGKETYVQNCQFSHASLPFRLCSWAYDANPAAKIATLLRFFGGKAADAASSPFERITKQKEHPLDALFVWCGRWDLNPYGLPYAPQTYASADSATTAKRCRSRDKNNYTGFTAACQHKKESLFLWCGLHAKL